MSKKSNYKTTKMNKFQSKLFACMLALAVISGVFVAETMAGKGKGEDDIM